MNDSFNTAAFLDMDSIHKANEVLQFPKELLEAIQRAITLIKNNKSLINQALACHDLLLQFTKEPTLRNEVITQLTSAEKQMGDQAGMFAAVLIISTLPHVRSFYSSKGIPDSTLIDTYSDLYVWMKHHHHKNGHWGLSELGWILNLVQCRIFKIGRLQYIHTQWEQKIRVYRHTTTGSLQALSEAFEKNGGLHIVGYPITLQGEVQQQVVELYSQEWELILAEGSPVLELHIQEGGKLNPELSKDSMQGATRFFKNYFPDLQIDAFVCSSWLLGPSLLQVLPAESNIIQFQKLFHLVHAFQDDNEIFKRVFGEKPSDLSLAPRDSGLQRAVIDHALSGKHFDQAVGFILND
jgi:hypothetical protein